MKKKPTLSEVLQIVKAGFSAIEAKMATKDDLAGLEAKVDNGFTELSDIAGVRADIISIKQDMVDLKAGAFTQAREGGPPRTSQIHRGRSREPHGQAAALAQGAVIAGPIRHLVPLLRDVLTAILVRFEWHDDCPRVRNRAALLLPVTPRPPKTDPCNKVARRRETDVRNTGTRVWPRSRLSGASRTMRSEPRSKATVARGLAGCDRSSVEFSQVERRGG